MKKKIIIFLISLVVITAFLILIYGDKIIIADYMPGESFKVVDGKMVSQEVKHEPWDILKERAKIRFMKINFTISLLIVTFESIILFKTKIFGKNISSILMIIALVTIPTVISTIIISTKFTFTS